MVKASDSVTYNYCVQVYQTMSELGKTRSGLWLEANDYDISFLSSFQDEIVVYMGMVRTLAEILGFTNQLVSSVIATMKACGWVIFANRRTYLLIREPNEEDFEQYKLRTKIVGVGERLELG